MSMSPVVASAHRVIGPDVIIFLWRRAVICATPLGRVVTLDTFLTWLLSLCPYSKMPFPQYVLAASDARAGVLSMVDTSLLRTTRHSQMTNPESDHLSKGSADGNFSIAI